MADELDRQIQAVQDKIAEVENEIKEVTEQLKPIVAQLADPELLGEPRAEVLEEKKRLATKEEQLRTKEHDLREKEKLLMAKQQHGAGCRSWPATILCARTLVACLLSCHALLGWLNPKP